MTTGPVRRIGFPFVGLLAADAFLLLLVLVQAWASALVCAPSYPTSLFLPVTLGALGLWAMMAVVTVAGWIVAGLPVVLLIPSRLIEREPWWVLLPIGAAIGPLSAFLAVVLFTRGEFSLENTAGLGLFFAIAALVSGSAFAVHCVLIKVRGLSN
jgi:hypothetical protein